MINNSKSLTGNSTVNCTYCNETFKNTRGLGSHNKSKKHLANEIKYNKTHTSDIPNNISVPIINNVVKKKKDKIFNDGKIRCGHCKQTFRSIEGLLKHVNLGKCGIQKGKSFQGEFNILKVADCEAN